jgi:hypothetical protein
VVRSSRPRRVAIVAVRIVRLVIGEHRPGEVANVPTWKPESRRHRPQESHEPHPHEDTGRRLAERDHRPAPLASASLVEMMVFALIQATRSLNL